MRRTLIKGRERGRDNALRETLLKREAKRTRATLLRCAASSMHKATEVLRGEDAGGASLRAAQDVDLETLTLAVEHERQRTVQGLIRLHHTEATSEHEPKSERVA
jgi:hypothetical protein